MSLLQECFRRSQSGSDIHAHLPRLFELASKPHVKIIELGVRGGDSTSAFLAAAEEQGGEVWSVDITDPRVPAEWRDLPFWYLTVGDDLEVSKTATVVDFDEAKAPFAIATSSHPSTHLGVMPDRLGLACFFDRNPRCFGHLLFLGNLSKRWVHLRSNS